MRKIFGKPLDLKVIGKNDFLVFETDERLTKSEVEAQQKAIERTLDDLGIHQGYLLLTCGMRFAGSVRMEEYEDEDHGEGKEISNRRIKEIRSEISPGLFCSRIRSRGRTGCSSLRRAGTG